MKLSLSNCSSNQYLAYGVSLTNTLRAVRDCGFSCVDLDILAEYLDDIPRRAAECKAALDSVGLCAPTAHAPCINLLKRYNEAVDILTKALLFCREAAIPCVVIHPGTLPGITREEFFEKNAKAYRSLIPIAEQTGVMILVENIGNYADEYFLFNGSDLRELVDRIDHPLFAACWDIGHANHFFEKDCEQYSSIVALGDKLVAIHAHDNCGYISDSYKHSRLDAHTFPYYSHAASVNWDAVLQGLVDIGYRGTFNFEINAPATQDRVPLVYHGEVVERLRIPPIEVWTAFNTALYKMGAAMLEAYGVYEG